jgi:hypothetical protein
VSHFWVHLINCKNPMTITSTKTSSKLDLVKHYKSYYSARNTPEVLTLEEAHYLSLTGQGDPNGADFKAGIQALFPVAYGIKFLCKSRGKDFTVPKLEAQWWFDKRYAGLSMAEAPRQIPRADWQWRLLIRLPDFVTAEVVASVRKAVLEKKKVALIGDVSCYTLTEGKVVQMLHNGPFDREPESLQIMQEFMTLHNLQHAGHHHEIYLSDFNKVAPAKLKTILREPVQ